MSGVRLWLRLRMRVAGFGGGKVLRFVWGWCLGLVFGVGVWGWCLGGW